MDRALVYAGELPRLEDFMGFEKDALYALGYLAQSVLGSGVCVQGLACTPNSPATLQVNVGPGSIYAQEPVDSNAFGGLGTDTNTIVKQGLSSTPQSLTITPPSTSGYSQVYLVQAAYDDIDSNPIVLPYYNASNPSQPLSGPSNSGDSQYTVRAGLCAIALKAGVASPTGTQTAPAADVGFTPLYTITVSNGQTQITSGNISVHPAAPFIPLNLNQVPAAIQEQSGNYALDTGSANSLQITLPNNTILTNGMPLRIKKGPNPNTGAITVAVSAANQSTVTLTAVWQDGSAFVPGNWPGNAIGEGIVDGAFLKMHGPIGPSILGLLAGANVYIGSDSGSADNLQVTSTTPNLTAYASGQIYLVLVNNDNITNTPQIQLKSLGELNIRRNDGSTCRPHDLQQGSWVALINSGSYCQILGRYTNEAPTFPLQVFTTTMTFTVPAGVYFLRRVRVWGGGGAGGGSSGVNQSSSGGGGGGYAEACNIPVTPGQVISVTVGAGGTCIAGPNYGNAGGASIFGSDSPITGNGGGGGSYNGLDDPGIGGAGSGGDISHKGYDGGFSFALGDQTVGGFGGTAPFSAGIHSIGVSGTTGGPGENGIYPGGGANGACTGPSGGSFAGGPGADGLVLVEI